MSEETFYRNMALGTAATTLLGCFFIDEIGKKITAREQKYKRIMGKNEATLSFYRNMALGSSAASLLVNFIFFEICKVTVIMSILSLLTLGAAYLFMVFISEVKFIDSGVLLYCYDLNEEGCIAENVKELIILTSSTMLLVIVSNYFWFLLLLAPISAVWLLWG